MTLFDDLEPRNLPPKPKDLSPMGIAELTEYIAGLKAEIARAEAMIAQKRLAQAGAEAVFKR